MNPEEKPNEEEQVESYYDDIRADIETAVYTYSTLEEIDGALQGKAIQNSIKKAKEDCILIMCKGLEILKCAYEEE